MFNIFNRSKETIKITKSKKGLFVGEVTVTNKWFCKSQTKNMGGATQKEFVLNPGDKYPIYMKTYPKENKTILGGLFPSYDIAEKATQDLLDVYYLTNPKAKPNTPIKPTT